MLVHKFSPKISETFIITGRAYTTMQSGNGSNGTVASLTEQQAQEKANMLIQMLPGKGLFQKTSFATIGGSLVAIAIANNIYIPNEETPLFVAFILFIRFLQVKLGPMISDYAEKGIIEMRAFWVEKFFGQKRELQEQLTYIGNFQNQQQVVDEYTRIKKENISLEAELKDLLEVNKYLHSIRLKLEDRVRKIQEQREQERQQLVASLLERVMSDLKDPKFQDSIMKQCLVDLDKIGSTMKAAAGAR